MVVQDIFCQLGGYLEEWERGDVDVHSVTVSDVASADEEGALTAEVEVSVPVSAVGRDEGAVTACTPTLGQDGTLELDLRTDVRIASPDDAAVDFEPADATFDPEGRVRVTFAGTVRSEDGDTGAAQSPAGTADGAGTTSDAPPFRNPELLQEVYDTHDTFAEMADALDMDVTGETVRRYMIDYDIHQPSSYARDEGTDGPSADDPSGGDEEAVILSDGIGLPENVSVEALIESVNNANTIFEVKEDLDMERKEAHEMLKDLDLVSVVMGRLANDSGPEMQREDIVEHLRQVSSQR